MEPLIDWDAEFAGYLKGDRRATERLLAYVREYLPCALAKIDPSLDAEQREEIVARTFEKLHAKGKLRQYRGPKKLLGFVRQVLATTRIDFFREKQRRPIHVPIDTGVDPADTTSRNPFQAAMDAELRKHIEEAFAALSRDHQEIIERRLLRVPPQDYHELARELGISYGNAQGRLNRALKQLKKELKKRGVQIPGEKFI